MATPIKVGGETWWGGTLQRECPTPFAVFYFLKFMVCTKGFIALYIFIYIYYTLFYMFEIFQKGRY